MNIRFSLSWVALIVLLGTMEPALAAEKGSGWSIWNPFKSDKSSKKKVTASVTDQPHPSGFELPKLPSLPKLSLPSMTSRSSTARQPAVSSGPSTWDKITKSTKQFFSKAYDVLTPWDNKPDAPVKPPVHGSSHTGTTGMSSWLPWSKKPSSQGPKTVNEFIAQPRVTP